MDRVLTQGFAFSLQKMYNTGIFKVSRRAVARMWSLKTRNCTHLSIKVSTLLILDVCVSVQEKKAMLSFTTGATQTMFRPDGINGDINVTLWPLQVRDGHVNV